VRGRERESAVVDIAVLLLSPSIFTLVASYQMAAAQLTFLTFVYTLSTADFVVLVVVVAADLCTICVLYVAVACCCCCRILYASTAAFAALTFCSAIVPCCCILF